MFRIRFKKKAYKDLLKVPSAMIKRVVAAIDELAIDPRPEVSKKLKGSRENLWRIRIVITGLFTLSRKPSKFLRSERLDTGRISTNK